MSFRPLLLLGLPLVAGCAKLGGLPDLRGLSPTVRFQDVRITEADFRQAEGAFVFALHNPNPVSVKLASFRYDLDVAGNDLVAGDGPEGLSMVADGDTEVVLPVTLAFADLLSLAQATRGVDQVPFTISGEVGFDTPLGVVRVPYRESGELPVLRPPKVRIEALRVVELAPLRNKARVELDVGLSHDQGAPLGFGDLAYDVSLGGSRAASGRVRDTIDVSAGEQATLTLPLDLDLLQIGRTAVDALTRKQPLDVGLDAAMQVETPLGRIPLQVDRSRRVEVR